MSIASKITDLVKRMGIDPAGVQGEIDADTTFNANFKKRLIPYGENRYFDPETNKVYEISDNGNRITTVLSEKEKSEITKGLPRS